MCINSMLLNVSNGTVLCINYLAYRSNIRIVRNKHSQGYSIFNTYIENVAIVMAISNRQPDNKDQYRPEGIEDTPIVSTEVMIRNRQLLNHTEPGTDNPRRVN